MLRYILLLALFVALARAALVDLSQLKQQLNEEQHVCEPACGAGQCCIHYYPPIHGKRAVLLGNADDLFPHSVYPGLVKRCEPLKQRGEKCLTRNTGEWCDCADGMTCHPDGVTGLDAFFGKCV